ncbi:tol-pal system-associated acyl-CoA thioesterase [Teredinibacter haidensis]|uniref:tol-pal system-associated acyl-CoA thioesterase n=1 Tax=Teredinibacter haidensis TaxID=2731755 RepID=UPI000948A8F5|nr:tol-pal system-associated acyl-CoA thioesterase [Teredinibacter haidensis]
MTEFSYPQRVYIEDTDAGGIVYYVNYLKFMERARTEFFRSRGFSKPAFIAEDRLMVVAAANVEYRRPAQLDDRLVVGVHLQKLARTYVVFEQEIFRGDEHLCSGTIKVACVQQQTMKPKALPNVVVAALRQSLGENS